MTCLGSLFLLFYFLEHVEFHELLFVVIFLCFSLHLLCIILCYLFIYFKKNE